MENVITKTKSNVFSAMLLVAGTCIGGGMLALPLVTGLGGFFPSIAIMALSWLAMTATALLLLEATLWMKEGAHFITMSSQLLGAPGKALSWLLYLFIGYSSLVAYTAGGGGLLVRGTEALFGIVLSKEISCILFIVLFGIIIDLGSQVVGRINTILFVAMMTAYVALVGMGVDEVKTSLLGHKHWAYSFWGIPVMLTTFSFQTIVPSLTPYLQRNSQSLRLAILGGTTLTFAIYVIWQWIILGIVPIEGPAGLRAALEKAEPATQFLSEHVVGLWIGTVAEFFAFFAIVTSFLGIGLGLFDFLADGLKISKKGWGKLALGSLIIIPTFVLASRYERAFLVAMETTGGIGDSILNGIMPVLMVWIGRYYQKQEGDKLLPGGKASLLATLLFFVSALIIQIIVLIPSR